MRYGVADSILKVNFSLKPFLHHSKKPHYKHQSQPKSDFVDMFVAGWLWLVLWLKHQWIHTIQYNRTDAADDSLENQRSIND